MSATPPPEPTPGGTGAAPDSLWADAVRRLSDWDPPDGRQEQVRDDFVAHLLHHPDGIWRDGPPAHLTASALVLDADHGRALLTLHARAGRWLQLGGHLEPGDLDLPSAALRESAEESGLAGLTISARPVQLDRHTLQGAFGRCREHLDVRYVVLAPPGAREVCSSESLDLRWFELSQLGEVAGPELAELARYALSGLG